MSKPVEAYVKLALGDDRKVYVSINLVHKGIVVATLTQATHGGWYCSSDFSQYRRLKEYYSANNLMKVLIEVGSKISEEV